MSFLLEIFAKVRLLEEKEKKKGHFLLLFHSIFVPLHKIIKPTTQ